MSSDHIAYREEAIVRRLHDLWWSLREWLNKGRNARRTAAARARFWAEVRQGQREAESRSRS